MPTKPGKASAESKLEYILTVLSHAEISQPNYHAVSSATGQSSANNAQKKFKAYIEQASFALVRGQIVRPSDGGSGDDDEDNDDNAAKAGTLRVPKSTVRKAAQPKKVPANPSSTSASSSKKPIPKQPKRKATEPAPSSTATAATTLQGIKKRRIDVIDVPDDEDGPVNNDESVDKDDEKIEDPNDEAEIKSEDEETTDDEDDDDAQREVEADRMRRSRARSRTVFAEDVV